ncbi:MAG: ferrous iron transporter B, partial [Clostridia bacterium]|nr:ferrous iron transporter B [Clostridia bacterium]
MKVALTGNPNSGKTTMFNALTGSSEKVGNWAGVTVDKKEHPIRSKYAGKEQLIAVDLPGAYSMSPFTSEESITSAYVKQESPDVIINIVDATNLSRSLFFTTQLLELGIPMVVALNKSDINAKKETEIDVAALSAKLGCPVITTVSTSSKGLKALVDAAIARVGAEQKAPYVQKDTDTESREAVAQADRDRFEFVNGIVKEVEKRKVLTKDRNAGDKIDAVLTNKWLGIPIFALVMWAVFWISQAGPGVWLSEGLDVGETHLWGLVDCIGWFKEIVAGWLEGAHDIIQAIILEGIIEGVAAVVGFLPLVMVMYFLIALLEDCGYMSRATVVLDPIFKKVGLSGKSVIPFIIGTGCAIPGVMACRTIRNERERRATAMLAPFMPCGAKLPVISLFAGAFFDNAEWVGTVMYFVGIIIILLCALLVNKLTGFNGKRSFFIIELPEYKIPSFGQAFKSMCQRGWSYIVKAGTVILVCNFVVYMMQTYGWNFKAVEDPADSILAAVATPIAYVIAPIVGVALWQLAAAAVTGFIAKECVVSTLATVFMFEHLINEELEAVGSIGAANMGGISVAAGLAFLMFNLFTPPCFAAIGAMNAEMKSAKWLWAGIGLQFSVG